MVALARPYRSDQTDASRQFLCVLVQSCAGRRGRSYQHSLAFGARSEKVSSKVSKRLKRSPSN